MSINIAFYGSKCFDLLHYVSRVLKACNISSIMIDWSVDQSLYKSVPNPGIQENEVINYRGVDVSTNYRKSMSLDYDVIFYYIGQRRSAELEHFYANYGFIVTSTELQEVEQAKSLSINFSKFDYLKDDSECEEDEPVEEVFERNHTYLLILGFLADKKKKFISSELEFPLRDTIAVPYDAETAECRINCMYDNVFRFSGISAEFQELIDRLCLTVLKDCGIELTPREYRKLYKMAERGK